MDIRSQDRIDGADLKGIDKDSNPKEKLAHSDSRQTMSAQIRVLPNEFVIYLMEELDREEQEQLNRMEGTIRPRGRCPECDPRQSFQFINSRLGYACPRHPNLHKPPRPDSYMLDLWHGPPNSRKRTRIYRDQYGMVLKGWDQGKTLQKAVTVEIANGTFKIQRYKPLPPSECFLKFRWDRYLASIHKVWKKKLRSTKGGKNTSRKTVWERVEGAFGAARDIRTIMQSEIQKFYKDLKESGLKPKTAKDIAGHLVACLNYAKEDVPGIDVHLPDTGQDVLLFEANIPSDEESNAAIRMVPLKYRFFCTFTKYHCQRPAESLAIQVKHVNFRGNWISIEQNYVMGEIQPHTTKTGKTWKIPIQRQCIEPLKRICLGKSPDYFIFSDDGSLPWNWAEIASHLTLAIQELELDCAPYNVLKHSAMSALDEKGQGKGASKLAGHVDESMLIKHYTGKRAAWRAMQSALDATDIPQDLLENS
jgi:integrase